MTIKIGNAPMGWGLPGFYFLGREWLINMGMLRPQDAVDDVIYPKDVDVSVGGGLDFSAKFMENL